MASFGSNPSQTYFKFPFGFNQLNSEASYMKLQNGSLDFFVLYAESNRLSSSIAFSASAQFMRLNPDGHLKVYNYDDSSHVYREIADIFSDYLGECGYPMVCGEYGICSGGQCSCPKSSIDSTNYFSETIDRQPGFGCSAITPLSCSASQYHSFVELEDVAYFSLDPDISSTNIDHCKEACLRDCSCKAAMFRSYPDPSRGDCYLPSEIFSLMDNKRNYNNASAFLKVQIAPTPMTRKKGNVPTILGSIIGGSILLVMIIVVVFKLRKKQKAGETEEAYLDNVPGMPTRFSYE